MTFKNLSRTVTETVCTSIDNNIKIVIYLRTFYIFRCKHNETDPVISVWDNLQFKTVSVCQLMSCIVDSDLKYKHLIKGIF